MKKTFLFFFVFLLFSSSYAIADSSKKIILTTQEWSPYQTYDNKVLGGFAVEVVHCIMDKIGQPYEISVYPWNRAQKIVQMNMAHGFFSASKNKIRDQYATISEPIASQKWNWYLLKGSGLNPADQSFKKEASVAAMWSSNMLTWLQGNGYQVSGHPASTEDLIKTLLLKRHDAVLANERVARDVFKDMNLSVDKFSTYLCREKPLGVYWSKQFLSENPGFLDKFNSHIQECQ